MHPFYECALCGDPYSFCSCAVEIERERRRTQENLAHDLRRWRQESDAFMARTTPQPEPMSFTGAVMASVALHVVVALLLGWLLR